MELFREGKPDFLAICEVSLFWGISPNQLEQLGSQLSFREDYYSKDEIVFRCGQAVPRLAIITKGAVSADIQAVAISETDAMGKFVEGDILGLETVFSSRCTSPSDIVVTTNTCSIVSFNLAPLLNVSTEPEVSIRFMNNWISLISDRYIRMIYWVRVLNQRSLREKILTFVYIMCSRDNSDFFDLRMTQDEFASYLRVARQSLNRELQALKREGFLSIEGRRYTLLRLPNNWRSGWSAFANEQNMHPTEQSGL